MGDTDEMSLGELIDLAQDRKHGVTGYDAWSEWLEHFYDPAKMALVELLQRFDIVTSDGVPMTVPPEIEATWWREAAEKITTKDIGSHVVVLVEGHKVAEFSTWAALITKSDAVAAAQLYVERVRQSYVALAYHGRRG